MGVYLGASLAAGTLMARAGILAASLKEETQTTGSTSHRPRDGHQLGLPPLSWAHLGA